MNPIGLDIPPAKFNPPAAPLAEVVRKSLCSKVTGAGALRVTVVHAPARFGKTAALLQLRARYERRVSRRPG